MTRVVLVVLLACAAVTIFGTGSAAAQAQGQQRRPPSSPGLVELMIVYFGHAGFPEAPGFDVLVGEKMTMRFVKQPDGRYMIDFGSAPAPRLPPVFSINGSQVSEKVGPITRVLEMQEILENVQLAEGKTNMIGVLQGSTVEVTRQDDALVVQLYEGEKTPLVMRFTARS